MFAGGGSTITLPVLIFAGLDAATANGTNRIAILFQNISGISSFRSQKIRGMRIAIKYALFTLPGAIAGAFFSIHLQQEVFEKILAVIMIAIVFSLFSSKTSKYNAESELANPSKLFYISLVFVGFYGGFIQVGVGFLLIASLFYFLQTSLLRVNVYKLIIVIAYTIPVLLIFILNNKINWIAGFAMAGGNSAGAWLAAHTSVKKGDKFIKYILAAVIIIMAIKLWL